MLTTMSFIDDEEFLSLWWNLNLTVVLISQKFLQKKRIGRIVNADVKPLAMGFWQKTEFLNIWKIQIKPLRGSTLVGKVLL